MDTTIKQVIEESVAGSHAGTRDFPAHVMAVAARGVESYRVDFRELASTYFLPSGASHAVAIATHEVPIAEAFDEPAVVAAIRASQRGEIKYPEFIDRVRSAGCVGYVVWIAGRRVSYFGRRGETYVEHFPGQPS